MKKLFLALSFLSILSLSSCTVTKNVIEIPEENSKEVLETTITNKEAEVLSSEDYINSKTDGTVYFFKGNSNADGFDIIEDKLLDINTINLNELVEKAITLSPSIPKETKVNKVYIENKVAYVDLNDIFFDDPQTNASASNAMKVGTLTNLFFNNEFLKVDKIIFLKDGKSGELIGPRIGESDKSSDWDSYWNPDN